MTTLENPSSAQSCAAATQLFERFCYFEMSPPLGEFLLLAKPYVLGLVTSSRLFSSALQGRIQCTFGNHQAKYCGRSSVRGLSFLSGFTRNLNSNGQQKEQSQWI